MLARFDTNEIINLVNIQQKELTTQALTSSAGYVYRKGNFKFYSSISSAFKTPNVDDFGKIFEKKGDLTIPNPDLKPETSINYEFGSNLMHEIVDFDVAGFYTQVFDLMTKLPTTLGGDSSLTFNGEELNLVSVQNSGTANIYGVFGAFRLKFSPRLNWHTTATITKAHFNGSDEPVGHISPLYGKSTLTYKLRKVKLSCYTRFNARKKWSDFSDLNDNPDESVENFGSPAWATLNASVFTYLNPKLKIQIAAENILDAHYKTFASGISAPGRNYIGSVYFKF
jgi:hemoglobin/transferrin/lactoferrin receptor protein